MKKIWRGLRDMFQNEFMKQMKNLTDSGAPCQPYFIDLFQPGFILDRNKITNKDGK